MKESEKESQKRKNQLLWEYFKTLTTNYLEQLMTSRLSTFLITLYTLHPENIQSDMDEIGKAIEDYDKDNPIHRSLLELRLGLWASSDKMFSGNFSSKDSVDMLKKFDFVNLSLINQLIIQYTIFESFLITVFEILGDLNSKLWKKEEIKINKTKLEKLLKSDEIDAYFKDEYQFQVSKGKISKRFSKLKKELDMPISDIKKQIDELEKFKAIRDIYVHNDGKVNRKFQNLVETDIELDKKYPITLNYLLDISQHIRIIIFTVVHAIAKKLNVPIDELSDFVGFDGFIDFIKQITGKDIYIKYANEKRN